MGQRKPILIIICLFLLCTVIVAHVVYITYVETQITISNQMMSDHSATLILNNDHIFDTDDFINITNNEKDICITSKVYQSDELTVYLYWGDFFLSKINYNKDTDGIAFVGQGVISTEHCYLNLKKETIFKYDNVEYVAEVINIKSNSMLNNVAILKSNAGNSQAINKISIDGASQKAVDKVSDYLIQKYNARRIYEDNNFVERYMFNSYDTSVFMYTAFLLEVILCITSIMVIIVYYNDEVKIKNIIGISFCYIIKDILKSLLLCYGIACCTAFAAAFVLCKYALFDIDVRTIVLDNVIVFAIITATTCIYYLAATKVTLKNGIK